MPNADESDVTQKTITDELHLTKSTVHSIVKSLAAQDCIAFSDRKIGKEKVLVLTESGRTFAGTIMDTVHARERELLDALAKSSWPSQSASSAASKANPPKTSPVSCPPSKGDCTVLWQCSLLMPAQPLCF